MQHKGYPYAYTSRGGERMYKVEDGYVSQEVINKRLAERANKREEIDLSVDLNKLEEILNVTEENGVSISRPKKKTNRKR